MHEQVFVRVARDIVQRRRPVRLPDGTIRKRRKNCNEPGCAHELTFSCYHGLPLLSKDRTRRWFVGALDAARSKWDVELWAYVIMPEHAHVLLCPRQHDYAIAAIRKTIKQSVARRAIRYLRERNPEWLEHLLDVEGRRSFYRFWQAGGGFDRNIVKADTAWASVSYIHANPVTRGLAACETEWQWSSARWYAGMDGVVLTMDDCPPSPPVR